jgi:hypothetical protein
LLPYCTTSLPSLPSPIVAAETQKVEGHERGLRPAAMPETYGHGVSVRPSLGAGRAKETTMDVAVWLRNLGLQQYEALFRENDIDAEVLSDLTDGDLEKIGVSLGHRKRLLKAIATLAGPPAEAASRQTPTTPSVANSPSCSQASSARPRCQPGSTLRTCELSSSRIAKRLPRPFTTKTASSPNIWETAF